MAHGAKNRIGIREMADSCVSVFLLMAKNIAEAWIAWSLNAARNWAISRPMKVRLRRVPALTNAAGGGAGAGDCGMATIPSWGRYRRFLVLPDSNRVATPVMCQAAW